MNTPSADDFRVAKSGEDSMPPTLEDVSLDSPQAGVAVVSFTGEHDLSTRDSLAELLDALVRKNDLVVADFSGAQFVDSSLLHVLVVTNRLARERGKTFRLQLGTEAIVSRAFEISGLLEQISWASSRKDALGESPKATSRVV